jgi:hypothetical protein
MPPGSLFQDTDKKKTLVHGYKGDGHGLQQRALHRCANRYGHVGAGQSKISFHSLVEYKRRVCRTEEGGYECGHEDGFRVGMICRMFRSRTDARNLVRITLYSGVDGLLVRNASVHVLLNVRAWNRLCRNQNECTCSVLWYEKQGFR